MTMAKPLKKDHPKDPFTIGEWNSVGKCERKM